MHKKNSLANWGTIVFVGRAYPDPLKLPSHSNACLIYTGLNKDFQIVTAYVPQKPKKHIRPPDVLFMQ